MKRFLIPITLLLVLVLTGIIVWLFVGSGNTGTDTDRTDDDTGPSFNPFGLFGNPEDDASETRPPETGDGPTQPSEAYSIYERAAQYGLYQISTEPTAGATFVTFSTGASTTEERLRFVSRESGHVFDVALDTGAVHRISNTTVPRIQEALWGAGGGLLALRYLDTNTNALVTLLRNLETSVETGSSTQTDSFLPENIRTIALSPTKPHVFYTVGGNTGSVGRLYDTSSKETSSVFSSPLRDLSARWGNDSTVVLFPKPGSGAFGVVELFDTEAKTSDTLSDDLPGVTALQGLFGDNVLLGSAAGTELRTYLFDFETGERSMLPFSTLPEKCAWVDSLRFVCAIPEYGPQNLPDSWYQGLSSFSDVFWITDTSSFEFEGEPLFSSADAREPFGIDAINLTVDSSKRLVSFINKKDLSLWVGSLKPLFVEESSLVPSEPAEN